MSSIFGLVLIVISIYFLGQNIIFTTHYYYYNWWQKTSATASVIALLAGISSLIFWRQTMGDFGWILIGAGIILVFLGGGVILQPTSLWTFCVSMLTFACGYQLLTKGKIRL